MSRKFLFPLMLFLPSYLVAGWFLPSVGNPIDVGKTSVGIYNGYANEGIASDGINFYTSRGFFTQEVWLVPYGDSFSSRKPVVALDVSFKIRHVGDITISNGVVFVPVSDYIPGGQIDYAAVLVYSAGDNSLLDVVDLSSELNVIGKGDLAGLEVTGTTLLMLEYQTRKSGVNPRIWRADLTQEPNSSIFYSGMEFDPNDFVEISTYMANGAAVQDDYLLVSFSEKPGEALWTDNENGYIDVYWLDDILSQPKASPIATFTFDVPEIHAEGITFFNDQLWTAQDNQLMQLETPSIDEYMAQEAPLVKHWENKGKRRSHWFGWFEIVHDDSIDPSQYRENWLYHFEHGWIYIWKNSQDNLIYYDYSLETYAYTSRSVYPYHYYFYDGIGDWVFYYKGGFPGSRWFYSTREAAFKHEPQMKEHVGYSLIPASSFQMGNSSGEYTTDDLPVHEVYVSEFYMQKTEVTNTQMAEVLNWAIGQGLASASNSIVQNLEGEQRELMELDDSKCQISWNGSQLVVDSGKGNYPCVDVSWYGAMAYCNYLTRREGELSQAVDLSDWSLDLTATGYRLPTEAEWEKAARGGHSGWRYPNGDELNHSLALYGSSRSVSVGSFPVNGYDLHDMAGNVWEWCSDWYGSSYYSSSPSSDPKGPLSGTYRVLRGGGWASQALSCQVTIRDRLGPGGSNGYLGFRPIRN